MTRFPYLSAYLATLVVSVFLVLPSEMRSQSDSRDRELYDTPQLWNQLSSAYQMNLERRFGKKPARGTDQSKPSIEKKGEDEVPFLQRADINHLTAFVNVLVNNAAADATTQDTQSETSLILGSGSVILAGFNDSGSHVPTSNNHFTGVSRSTDGGSAWTDQGMLLNSANGDAGDPVFARSASTGTIILSTLGFTSSTVLQIFRSIDNGASYAAPVNGASTAVGSHDKQWVACDNFAGAGQGNFYMFWRDFGGGGGMTFTRSTNDGVAWTSRQILASNSGQGAWVVVGPDHAVYCLWLSGTSIVIRKSTDQGVTFGAQTTVTTLATAGVNGDLGLGGGFRTNAFPQTVINPVSGNIYMVYNDKVVSPADKGNIYFRQSTDGGATWSAATKINTDSTTNDQWQPSIAIRPDGTGFAVCWYDRRTDPANSLIERWGRIGNISGSTVTFSNNFKISPQFGVVVGVDPAINTVYMGDYDQMDADNNFYYTVWGDNRDQSIAAPARKNANVRFAKIPVAGPTPAPFLNVATSTLTGGNGNGVIDFNECNDYAVSLRNDGDLTATGVSATLSTTAANVTITTSTATYPDISPGGTAASVATFKISSSNAYVCGTAVPLKLVVSYGATTDSFNLSAPVLSGYYSVTQSTGAAIVPGTTDIGNHGDDVVTAITLPFSYQFYDGIFTTVNACSNGNLQFITTSNVYGNSCFPISLFNYAIVPHWDDQRTDSVGRGIFTSTTGVSPNRIFNIEWRSTLYAGGGSLNYEVRLYEAQQKFEIIYGSPLINSGLGATVGIQKGTGTEYLEFSCNTASLSSGLKLTYQAATCSNGGGDCPSLPIQLASFTGRAIGTNTVQLDWTTVSEINNYGFEIQKGASLNGVFETITGSFVPGHGTTLIPQHYQWTYQLATSRSSFYRLKQMDLDGTVHYFDPIQVQILTDVKDNSIPTEFSLAQNYPNPFNPSTTIKYGLPKNAHVTLEVFNTLGQRVAVLADEMQEAGYHHSNFDGQSLASGLYMYKLTAGSFVETKKLILLK